MHARQALIYHDHLCNNLDIIRSLCPTSKICLAVKANAYGHGAVEIAQVAAAWGTEALGVATITEAVELRKSGITCPILLYGIPAIEEYRYLIEYQIHPFIVDALQLTQLANLAKAQGTSLAVHIKVDTGMGRIGVSPEQAFELCRIASTTKGLVLGGICTHFPAAEDQKAFTEGQIAIIQNLAQEVRSHGFNPGIVHAANSAGLVIHPNSRLDMVRPGLLAYGYPPLPNLASCQQIKAVMELRTSLRFIKKVAPGTSISYGRRWFSSTSTWIGTIPLGYADGLPRLASGKLLVTINGRRYPQVGTICMDQCMIDLGPEDPPALESPVIIFGPGDKNNGADSLADLIGTIPYEILCGISPRVPRVTSERQQF